MRLEPRENLIQAWCHDLIKKRVDCDSHMSTEKVATFKWHLSSHVRTDTDRYRDTNKEDDVSSNLLGRVCIKAKLRHK